MNKNKTMLVTVIIPVYNDTKRLKLCLQALNKQTLGNNNFEIIVIDNNSQNPVSSICSTNNNVTILTEKKAGSYIARNSGIKHASGKYIAFTDSDCIPEPNWLENGIKQLQKNKNIGLIGGRIHLFYQNPNHLSFSEIYEKHTAFQQQRYIEQYNFAATANMFTRKELFYEVGLFNEKLKSSGDKEWGERVFNSQYQLVYADNVVVQHPARHSLKELYSKRIRVIGGAETLRNKTGILSIIDYDLVNGMIPPIKEVKSILKSKANKSEKLIALSIVISMTILSTFTRLQLRLGGKPSR